MNANSNCQRTVLFSTNMCEQYKHNRFSYNALMRSPNTQLFIPIAKPHWRTQKIRKQDTRACRCNCLALEHDVGAVTSLLAATTPALPCLNSNLLLLPPQLLQQHHTCHHSSKLTSTVSRLSFRNTMTSLWVIFMQVGWIQAMLTIWNLALQYQPSCTSAQSQENKDTYACNSESICKDLPVSRGGYNCFCPGQMEGNPYVVDGCIGSCASLCFFFRMT